VWEWNLTGKAPERSLLETKLWFITSWRSQRKFHPLLTFRKRDNATALLPRLVTQWNSCSASFVRNKALSNGSEPLGCMLYKQCNELFSTVVELAKKNCSDVEFPTKREFFKFVAESHVSISSGMFLIRTWNKNDTMTSGYHNRWRQIRFEATWRFGNRVTNTFIAALRLVFIVIASSPIVVLRGPSAVVVWARSILEQTQG